MIKCFFMIKKKINFTQEEFLRYWKEKHGPLAAKAIPGLKKYVQYHPVEVPGVEFKIDGIAEIWWDNLQSLENYLAWRRSAEAKVLIADEEKFVDTSQSIRFFAEEQVIVER
jgi:uncharacterized protein (TIGR02118 family)